MTITEVRGYLLEADMAAPIRNAVGMIARRNALVVELVTDTGVSGWGETQDAPAAAWAAIESGVARAVLGTDPLDFAPESPLAAALVPVSRPDALAKSAIDIALWDLRGRLEGASIAELLGVPARQSIPAYASGPFMIPGDRPYANMLDDAQRFVDAGYRAIKLRCGTTPHEDLALVAEMRDRLGPDIRIAIDINTGYAERGAPELVSLAHGSGLAWIEEPIGPLDLPGYLELSAASSIPLAAGEALWRPEDFDRVIDGHAVDLLQPDLFLCGGVTGALHISAAAHAVGIPVLPHVFGTGINFAASLQVAAVLPAMPSLSGPDYPWFEFDQSDNPLRAIGGAAVLDSLGGVPVPRGPGIGVDIDAASFEPFVHERHRVRLSDREGS